jgi:hypothetical protein
MAELQTKRTKASVAQFIAKVPDAGQRADAKRIAAMMKRVTGKKAEMWGPAIVGFGSYVYRKDGGEMPVAAFSPRKGKTVLYIYGLEKQRQLLKEIGSPECGKVCVYVKRLADLNERALEKLVRISVKTVRALEPR